VEKAIAKVRRTQPAAYLKCLVLLVPREHKVEHSNPLKAMTDEELDAAIAALRDLLARREAAAKGKLIDAEPVEPALIGPPLDTDGTAEPATIPAPALTDEQIDATLDALREITRGVRQRGGENVSSPMTASTPARSSTTSATATSCIRCDIPSCAPTASMGSGRIEGAHVGRNRRHGRAPPTLALGGCRGALPPVAPERPQQQSEIGCKISNLATS
jgi:hypothetical protein